MVSVCERAKTKNDMLQESIEMYKDLYIRAKAEFNKVVTVSTACFSVRGPRSQ
jgi:DNA topoisomerase-3